MISVKTFQFNPFQTNTFILIDDSKECAIIDAACENDQEKRQLKDFIEKEGLNPVRSLFTHCHVDHILGSSFVEQTWGLAPEVHASGKFFWEMSKEFASVFNVSYDTPFRPERFLNEGDIIKLGHSELEIFYTPGHADGSICFWCKAQDFVIVGDVLFYGSIGRTDLHTGSLEILSQSIRSKLFTLKDKTIVYCGHGPETSIGFEKLNNPYVGAG